MNDVYTAPMRDIAPMGAPNAYTDVKKINALLRSTDPETVAASGRSYQDFARKYGTIADDLLAIREDLLDAWHGEDAAAAQSQLREVWEAATTVQKTAGDFGVAVERHGSESLWWYKNRMPTSTSLGEAQSWMTGANDRISESWNALPADISTTLPPPPKHSRYAPPAADPRLSAAGGGGSLPSGPRSLSVDSYRTQGTPISGSASGADLAGLSPGSPPSLAGGLSTGGTAGGLPAGGTTPGLGGVGGLGGAGGLESGGVIGAPGGLTAGTAKNAAMAEEAQAAEAGAASRSGLFGPMPGGAGGQRQQERSRENWIAEDAETWSSDQVAPQVIGEREPEPEPEPETPVDVDLTGDDDIADLLNELNEDEPADPTAEIAALRAKLERLERQVESDKAVSEETTGGLGWMTGEDK